MTSPTLHAVTDDRVLARPDFLARAAALALGPRVALHVRTRRDGRFALDVTTRLVALARPTGTRVIVNDRVDVALLAGADGVHLPEAGLPVRIVRRLAPELLVGRSVHSTAAAAASDADWTFLGPIWPSASHPARVALDPGALTGGGPGVVAIGGVTAARAGEAMAHGARGLAAVRGLWDAPDPAAAAVALLSFVP